jgi:hypothetical protein
VHKYKIVLMDSEFNIMVGGEAGQGVQSVGAILAASLGLPGVDCEILAAGEAAH